MVKKGPSELNLLRQRRRSAIQLYIREHPQEKMNAIAKIYKVSPVTVAKWKKRNSFIDSKRKRKSKMTKKIANFLLLALSIPVNLFFALLRRKFFIFFVIFEFLFLFLFESIKEFFFSISQQ